MSAIDLLSSIDAEISRLQQARALLAGSGTGRPKKSAARPGRKKKRTMSVEARAKIAEAQRKRWAKQKKAAK
jgi:hypothetical protein